MGLRAWRQLRVVGVCALLIAGLMSVLGGQRFWPSLLFCLCISVCCSALIQGFAAGFTALLNQRRAPGTAPLQWPGWPLMLLALLLGTPLGYGLGNEVGRWLSGIPSGSILQASPRQLISVLLLSLLPGLGASYFFVSRSRLQAAQLQAQTAQRQAAEHQLRLLESQLEPHMLFNTLANLRVLIALDPQRAQAMLDQLIAFLRATLRASRTSSHSLGQEFARLQDYLALMQIRMGARLRPSLDLPAELAELQIPPLLLQALVENAIQHGLEPSVEGGELYIGARLQGKQLLLEVRDGGVGLASPTLATEGTRFGLHQVRERLHTQFGGAASFQLGPRGDGHSGALARILLPVQTPHPPA
nr:histidine kinase [Roseateles oligotrophus]